MLGMSGTTIQYLYSGCKPASCTAYQKRGRKTKFNSYSEFSSY